MKHGTRLAALILIAGVGAVALAQKDKDKAKTVTTKSGLKYEVLKEGKGDAAKAGELVSVHYTLWLAKNNKKVDSSAGGAPLGFILGKGEVVKGFDEGVAGMKVGGKRKLMIPAKLGYGEKGADDDIPPNSDLIFEVELVKIIALTPTKSSAKTVTTKS